MYILKFIKKDFVLFISFILMIFSILINPISHEYINFIDFKTLVLLFSLMIVIEMWQEIGIIRKMATFIINFSKNLRSLVLTLVLICFFSSMIITNDVALITFVPIALFLFENRVKSKVIIFCIVMMTIAANLGSMATPIGNPQNLYIYGKSNMDIFDFFKIMALPSFFSFIIIVLCVLFFIKGDKVDFVMDLENRENFCGKFKFVSFLIFISCLLCVLKFLNFWILLTLTFCCVFISDFKILKRVDYSLLLTFVCFFIFVGNLNSLDGLYEFLSLKISGNERIFGIIFSQIFSNVPTAMLFLDYSKNYGDLLIGTNIGGLGTLIASMASLISYRLFIDKFNNLKFKYLGIFTLFNILFLAILSFIFILDFKLDLLGII